MAKKNKRDERASFLFDDDAGRDRETIDLFGPDEPYDELDEEPYDEPDEEPDDADEEALSPDEPDKPEKTDGSDKKTDTPEFRFDRYGRRIGKKKARYGKRKNAPKATTTVIENETVAKREYDDARARSEARAKKRAREEAKKAALRKAERRKRRQRSLSCFWGSHGL